jgi:predicted ribosomally synthesized peptide with SipW-like signal peptide
MMDKKILASMLIIAAASMLLGAGTVAYFSDTETSKGNKFTVGLGPDLVLYPCGDQPTLPFVVGNIMPGDSGVADVSLRNDGPAAGWLSMRIINLVNLESGLLDPEIKAGDTSGGEYEGELGSKLYLIIWFDDNNDGERQVPWPDGGEQPIVEGYVDYLHGLGKIPIDGAPTYDIMPGYSGWWATIGFKWSLASDVGNIIQSDSLTFDIEFTLSEPEP